MAFRFSRTACVSCLIALAQVLLPAEAATRSKKARSTPKSGLRATAPAAAAGLATVAAGAAAAGTARSAALGPGQAEARLIEVYQALARGHSRQALEKAERLVREVPDFQLAQLVYGDILATRQRPVRALGDVGLPLNPAAAATLAELRAESQRRIDALLERPPAGTVPAEIIALAPRVRHAIAVDTSRSRLYLFENRPGGLALAADYYISVGRQGVDKSVEGDLRTPLGVYHVTSNLDPKSLSAFYGAGALPINYPNVLDTQRGKTGSGIWLHGTPPGQFSRAPQATDGCVVLTNPDLLALIRTVEVGTTPVVISSRLRWVTPQAARVEAKSFEVALESWRQVKSEGQLDKLLAFYSADFNSLGRKLADWTPQLRGELQKARGRALELKDVSMLRWSDTSDTMVVTFGEVPVGSRTGTVKRQYWQRQGQSWKIFFEATIA
ncbi:MAG: L,D-transpeptidase [Rhodoferax sp.]|nr:L,D-transpeptidase [Rhodoferax sp.]